LLQKATNKDIKSRHDQKSIKRHGDRKGKLTNTMQKHVLNKK